MKSVRTEAFRKQFQALPSEVQILARKAYELWRTDNAHPSLHFKRIHNSELVYSVRISRAYRALCLKREDRYVWFWIGSHDDYDRHIKTLKG